MERDILRGLTAKEFRAWEIYHEVEPFGDLRADYHAAQVVQMLHAVNRGKGQKALTLEECLLKFAQEEKPKQTPEQQFGILKVLAAMHANDGLSVPYMTTGLGLDPASDDAGILTQGGQVTLGDQVITSETTDAAIQAILEKARKAMN